MPTRQRKSISTSNAPQAIGPYSQAVRWGDLLFVSGMIAIDPQTGEIPRGNFGAETRLVLNNVKAVIEAAGMDIMDVLKATVFLTNLGDFGIFNEIYGEYFQTVLPARETVQVSALPRGASIEISVICAGRNGPGA